MWGAWRTLRVPRPGRCSCHGHGQYRHYLPRQLRMPSTVDPMAHGCSVPNGKHTSSFSETILLLHTTDSLLQDGRNLGRGGLRIGGVGSDGVGERRSTGLVETKPVSIPTRQRGASAASQRRSSMPSTQPHCGANGIENYFQELQAMTRRATGAIVGRCDGLTEAILPEAEIAATRRLDWRMALENIAAVLKRLLR